ncbi:hypothetical protein MN116_000195 [Schistosoma mekongi]|uniref:Uncharacterized protein n=1 Tax=Schistosoma mekongi TaxID=38744 RepID=A0AAE1Z6V3_SCHME|nr:hypothetical protein MN116_000195 [Schistosoma mekongi]
MGFQRHSSLITSPNLHHNFSVISVEDNAIIHIRSPPYYPQSNGQAGRFADAFKRSAVKVKGGENPSRNHPAFPTCIQEPPLQQRYKSPAKALIGRKLGTVNEVMSPAKVGSMEYDIYKNGTVYVRNDKPGNETWKKGG